jgi:hypothetical protein
VAKKKQRKKSGKTDSGFFEKEKGEESLYAEESFPW